MTTFIDVELSVILILRLKSIVLNKNKTNSCKNKGKLYQNLKIYLNNFR